MDLIRYNLLESVKYCNFVRLNVSVLSCTPKKM